MRSRLWQCKTYALLSSRSKKIIRSATPTVKTHSILSRAQSLNSWVYHHNKKASSFSQKESQLKLEKASWKWQPTEEFSQSKEGTHSCLIQLAQICWLLPRRATPTNLADLRLWVTQLRTFIRCLRQPSITKLASRRLRDGKTTLTWARPKTTPSFKSSIISRSKRFRCTTRTIKVITWLTKPRGTPPKVITTLLKWTRTMCLDRCHQPQQTLNLAVKTGSTWLSIAKVQTRHANSRKSTMSNALTKSRSLSKWSKHRSESTSAWITQSWSKDRRMQSKTSWPKKSKLTRSAKLKQPWIWQWALMVGWAHLTLLYRSHKTQTIVFTTSRPTNQWCNQLNPHKRQSRFIICMQGWFRLTSKPPKRRQGRSWTLKSKTVSMRSLEWTSSKMKTRSWRGTSNGSSRYLKIGKTKSESKSARRLKRRRQELEALLVETVKWIPTRSKM